MHSANCLNPHCEFCCPPLGDILDALNADDYRLDQLQCIPYTAPGLAPEHSYAHLFPEDWLSLLYLRMKHARVLARTYCGMLNLSHDAVLAYMLGKPTFACVRWHPDNQKFDTVGMGWIGTWAGVPPPAVGPRSAFGAYALFPEIWGHPDGELVSMLGLARMFRSYRLEAILGQRYASNELTARFMSRFGFRDIGTIPRFVLKRSGSGNGGAEPELADCVVSRLTRQDFTAYVERKLISLL